MTTIVYNSAMSGVRGALDTFLRRLEDEDRRRQLLTSTPDADLAHMRELLWADSTSQIPPNYFPAYDLMGRKGILLCVAAVLYGKTGTLLATRDIQDALEERLQTSATDVRQLMACPVGDLLPTERLSLLLGE